MNLHDICDKLVASLVGNDTSPLHDNESELTVSGFGGRGIDTMPLGSIALIASRISVGEPL